jgi:hypothetical protein
MIPFEEIRMRRFMMVLVLPVALLLLSGCSGAVVGRWQMAHTGLNRHVFAINKAEFKSDGTYAASATVEGVTSDETGDYEFDGFKLRMRPNRGGARVFDARIIGNELQLVDGKRKVVMVRAERAGG